MMSFHLKTFWKTFFKLEQDISRLWWLPPKQITILIDAQYYLFLLLWFGIGKKNQAERTKLQEEEPRQDLWSSRKKISIDHVAPQVGHKYQTMIKHMYTVLTWNIHSLSLSPPRRSLRTLKSWDVAHTHTYLLGSVRHLSDHIIFLAEGVLAKVWPV